MFCNDCQLVMFKADIDLVSYGTLQVNAAAEVIYDLVDPSANLIFGSVIDPSISGQVSLPFLIKNIHNVLLRLSQVGQF